MTAVDTREAPPPPSASAPKEEQPYVDSRKPRRTGLKLLGILVVWLVLYFALKNKMTRALGLQDTTSLHQKLNDARDWVQLHGQDNWFFGSVLGTIGDFMNWAVEQVQYLISVAAFPRIVPEIGWVGVVAIAAWITYVLAGLRSTILVTVSMLLFGVFGLWPDSMDLLIVTILSVVICIVIGLPIGIAMARNKTTSTVITPILDVLQTLPPFCYLAPMALFFGIGSSAAVVLTILYALPPIVRITEHAIKSVSPTTVEAARASGITSWQMIRKVQLPMSRSSIALAANQGLLYVLSMVVIGGMVGAGSLGYLVVSGFSQYNLLGKGLAAGIAVTALGILLDRSARAVADRSGT